MKKDNSPEKESPNDEVRELVERVAALLDEYGPALEYLRSLLDDLNDKQHVELLVFYPPRKIEDISERLKPRDHRRVSDRHKQLLRLLMEFVEHFNPPDGEHERELTKRASSGDSRARRMLRLYLIDDLERNTRISTVLRHYLREALISADVDALGFRKDGRSESLDDRAHFRGLDVAMLTRVIKNCRARYKDEFTCWKNVSAREIAAQAFKISEQTAKRHIRRWKPLIDRLESRFGQLIEWPPEQYSIEDFRDEIMFYVGNESDALRLGEALKRVTFLRRNLTL